MPAKRKVRALPPRQFQSRQEADLELRRLAVSLKRNNFVWPARAIQGFVDRDFLSLDEAFGLVTKPRRGRPRTRGTNSDTRANWRIARQIHALRQRATPAKWAEIAGMFPSHDPDWLRQMYNDFKNRLLSEDIELDWNSIGNDSQAGANSR